jgi:uncharacterized protein (TIGR03435 family)
MLESRVSLEALGKSVSPLRVIAPAIHADASARANKFNPKGLARLHDLRLGAGTRSLAPSILGRNPSLGDGIRSLLRRDRKFSTRPWPAKLGVSTVLLILLSGAGSLVPSWTAIAQTKPTAPPPKFEVAAIRVDKSSRFISRFMDKAQDGRFYATGPTLEFLIATAYEVDDWQIYGGPRWINTERFEIEARADSSADEELKRLDFRHASKVKDAMLQALLSDRFKLRLHRETRERPVYVLEVAKGGPKLQLGKNQTSDPYLPNAGAVERSIAPKGHEQGVAFQNVPISWLTALLSEVVGGRTVLDKTGLRGKYNFTLRWTPFASPRQMSDARGLGAGTEADGGGPSTPGMAPVPGSPASPDLSAPSIFTAIRQQLGLKLKPEKGPVEVLVIDHVEQPTPN